MKEQYTTYTIKAKTSSDVWVFKYHLNGDLYSFTILDGKLSQRQARWLFMEGNFPVIEKMIGDWQLKLKANFEITIGFPDISFEAFWEAYAHKTRKAETREDWKKLTDADKIKALEGIRRYNNHLRLNTWKTKVDPNRYLKKRRWEDEF